MFEGTPNSSSTGLRRRREAYAQAGDRRAAMQGLITPDSVPVQALRKVGWEWGGDGNSPKVYQHISAEGS